MYICDMHTHSCFSLDADKSFSPEDICRAAIEKGISDIAITDHFEANYKTAVSDSTRNSVYDHNAAYIAIMEAKEKYSARLNLIYGIEIGQANQCPDEARALLNFHNYEFVIGSMHSLCGMDDYHHYDLSNISDEQISKWFVSYFKELCQVVDTIHADTIAHITYQIRYLALANRNLDITKYYDIISELYKKIISKDVALEVNTSTLWRGLGFTMPDTALLKLYRECGGRLITVGSDAHSAQNIGCCIPEAFAIIKSCGFDSVLTVRQGQKQLVKI